jgi:magnesium-transporting ATPase (P-type)
LNSLESGTEEKHWPSGLGGSIIAHRSWAAAVIATGNDRDQAMTAFVTEKFLHPFRSLNFDLMIISVLALVKVEAAMLLTVNFDGIYEAPSDN